MVICGACKKTTAPGKKPVKVVTRIRVDGRERAAFIRPLEAMPAHSQIVKEEWRHDLCARIEAQVHEAEEV